PASSRTWYRNRTSNVRAHTLQRDDGVSMTPLDHTGGTGSKNRRGLHRAPRDDRQARREPAVHREDLPVHVARLVAREERDGRGDLLGLAGAAGRVELPDPVLLAGTARPVE